MPFGVFRVSLYSCTSLKCSINIARSPHMEMAGQPGISPTDNKFSLFGPFTHSCIIFSLLPGLPIVQGWREQKVPSELRRHLETKKQGRQLHIITGSIYYRVTYSQGSIRIWRTTIRKHSQLHSTLPRSRWDNFIVNLGYGGRCLGTGHSFLSQNEW